MEPSPREDNFGIFLPNGGDFATTKEFLIFAFFLSLENDDDDAKMLVFVKTVSDMLIT